MEQLTIPQDYYLNEAEYVIGDDVISFDVDKIELVESVGCLVYVKNALYPHKAFPDPFGIHAVNMVKSQLRLYLKFPVLFLFPKKLATEFVWFFDRAFFKFKVKRKYMCDASFNMYVFLSKLFTPTLGKELADNVAYAVAHIVEYDDAYRFRLQDMATELRVDSFKKSPIKETKRLLEIWGERESPGVMINIRRYAKLLLLVLYIPSIRKSIINNIQYIKKMQYDKCDWYWVAFKDNYKFGGKTHAERLAEGIPIPAMYSEVRI